MAPRISPGFNSLGSPKKRKAKSKRKASDAGTTGTVPDDQASKKPRSASENPFAAPSRPVRTNAGKGGRVTQLEKLDDILDGNRRLESTFTGPTSLGTDVPTNPLAPPPTHKRGGRRSKNIPPPPYACHPDGQPRGMELSDESQPTFVKSQGGRFGFSQHADYNPATHIVPPGTEPDLQALNNPYVVAARSTRGDLYQPHSEPNRSPSPVPQLSSRYSHTMQPACQQPSQSFALDPTLRSEVAAPDFDDDDSSTSREGDNSGEESERGDGDENDEGFGWAESLERRGEDPDFSFAQQVSHGPQASQHPLPRPPSPQFEFQYSRSEDEATLDRAIRSSGHHRSQTNAIPPQEGNQMRNAQIPPQDDNQAAQRSTGGSGTPQVATSAPIDVLQQHHRKNGGPRLPNPATLNRHCRTAENTTGCVANTDGPKPTQLSWYPGPWKQLLEIAKADCRLAHALENAFPNRVQDVPGSISTVLSKSIENWHRKEGQLPEGIYPEHKLNMAVLLYEDLSTWRSDLKKIARAIAPLAYGLKPPADVPVQGHQAWIENMATGLIHDSVFLHAGLDENGKTKNFAHVALRDAAIAFFYTGTYRIARKRPDIFRVQLPLSCLAMVAAAYNCVLDGFAANGSGKSIPKFSAQTYSSIYRGMLDLLHVLHEDAYHGQRLKQQLREWAQAGWAENVKIDGQDNAAGKHGHLRLKLD